MLGVTLAGRTTIVNIQPGATERRHVDFGGAVTLLGGGIIGAEAIGVLTPRFFQTKRSRLATGIPAPELDSSRALAMMGNVVVTVPRRWTEYFLRPFVSGGFGLLHAREVQVSEVLNPISANLAGFNVGGGAIGFLTQRTGVRLDVRYYGTLHGTVRSASDTISTGPITLHYMTASIGLVIRR